MLLHDGIIFSHFMSPGWKINELRKGPDSRGYLTNIFMSDQELERKTSRKVEDGGTSESGYHHLSQHGYSPLFRIICLFYFYILLYGGSKKTLVAYFEFLMFDTRFAILIFKSRGYQHHWYWSLAQWQELNLKKTKLEKDFPYKPSKKTFLNEKIQALLDLILTEINKPKRQDIQERQDIIIYSWLQAISQVK